MRLIEIDIAGYFGTHNKIISTLLTHCMSLDQMIVNWNITVVYPNNKEYKQPKMIWQDQELNLGYFCCAA